LNVLPEQIVGDAGMLFSVGFGFTVIVNVSETPIHAGIDEIIGVTVTLTVIGLVVLLTALPNVIVAPLPVGDDKPAAV
jgi:hypothetical protein